MSDEDDSKAIKAFALLFRGNLETHSDPYLPGGQPTHLRVSKCRVVCIASIGAKRTSCSDKGRLWCLKKRQRQIVRGAA